MDNQTQSAADNDEAAVVKINGSAPSIPSVVERLERARDGSVELDCYIAAAIGWVGVELEGRIVRWRDHRGIEHNQVPPYTSLIDAGLPVDLQACWEITGPRKYLNIPTTVPNYWRAEITFGHFPNHRRETSWAATEALARRAAELKALLALAKP